MHPHRRAAATVKFRPWISRFDPNRRATANLSESYRGHRFEIFISGVGPLTRTRALYIDGNQLAVDVVGSNNPDTIVAGIVLAKRLIDQRVAPESPSAPASPNIRLVVAPQGENDEGAAKVRRRTSPAELVSISERLGAREDDGALALVRLIAEHCAELADESGAMASGPDVARRIRQLFRL